ncbi:MAG: hypothetical protein DMF66_17975, partial [Acidobacteria bacterium]
MARWKRTRARLVNPCGTFPHAVMLQPFARDDKAVRRERCRMFPSNPLSEGRGLCSMRAVRAVRTRRQLMRATRGRTLKSCRLVCLSLAALALATAGWAQESFRLFPVSKGGKSGYITRDGRVRIAPRFDSAAEFHEGRARVTLGGRPAFVNTS